MTRTVPALVSIILCVPSAHGPVINGEVSSAHQRWADNSAAMFLLSFALKV